MEKNQEGAITISTASSTRSRSPKHTCRCLRPIFAEATLKRRQKKKKIQEKIEAEEDIWRIETATTRLRIGSWKETKPREEGKLRWLPQKGHRQKARGDEEAPIATPWELREQRSELGNKNTITSSLDYNVENKLLMSCKCYVK
jgi:hypothetical protein